MSVLKWEMHLQGVWCLRPSLPLDPHNRNQRQKHNFKLQVTTPKFQSHNRSTLLTFHSQSKREISWGHLSQSLIVCVGVETSGSVQKVWAKVKAYQRNKLLMTIRPHQKETKTFVINSKTRSDLTTTIIIIIPLFSNWEYLECKYIELRRFWLWNPIFVSFIVTILSRYNMCHLKETKIHNSWKHQFYSRFRWHEP
jgi:hypothetical protein